MKLILKACCIGLLGPMASCTDTDEKQMLQQSSEIHLTGTADGFTSLQQSRTQVGDMTENGVVLIEWSANDKIGVFGDNAVNLLFTGNNTEAAAEATFSGTAEANAIPRYAYYPYVEGLTDLHSIPVTISAEQTYADESSIARYDIKASQSITDEEDGYKVRMRQMAALVRFEIDLNGVGELTGDELMLRAELQTGAPVSGNFTYDLANPENGLTAEGTPGNSLNLTFANQPPITETVVAYAIMAPGEQEGTTWTCTFHTDRHKVTFTTQALCNLEAGKYYTLPLNAQVLENNQAEITEITEEEETANCYIVTETGRHDFLATVIGNGQKGIIPNAGFHTESAYINPQSAKLLWSDVENFVSDVSLENGRVYYNVNSLSGNAVIAVYDEPDQQGNILWSWHIWGTGGETPADEEYTNRVGTQLTVMDRNIGAHNKTSVNAMLYQWGRKDPFPAVAEYGATSGTGVVAVSEGNTGSWGLPSHTPIDELKSANQTLGFSDLIFGTDAIENCCQLKTEIGDSFTTEQSLPVSIKYPYRWMSYEGSNARWNEYVWSAPYNMLSTSEERFSWRYLWGNPNPNASVEQTDNVKTIYDPCPPGWKVMPRLAWEFVDDGLETLTNGYYSPVYDLYFPFTGQRQAGFGGSLIQAVDMQYLHTCNVGGTAQWEVIRNMLTNNLTYTAAGHNVRCVKEDMVVADLPHRGPLCVLIGDSITRTWNSYDGGFFSSNNLLAKGADGQTSQQILDRFYSDVITNTPPAVHIMCGINDIANNDGANRTNEGIFANIKAMAEMAAGYRIKVMIGSTPPANYIWWVENAEQWNEEHPDTAQRVIDLNEDLKAYCKENGFIYVDYWAALVDTDEDNLNGLKEEYQVDAVHPNTECFQTVMGPIFLDALDEALYIPGSAEPGGQLDDFDREDITLN